MTHCLIKELNSNYPKIVLSYRVMASMIVVGHHLPKRVLCWCSTMQIVLRSHVKDRHIQRLASHGLIKNLISNCPKIVLNYRVMASMTVVGHHLPKRVSCWWSTLKIDLWSQLVDEDVVCLLMETDPATCSTSVSLSCPVENFGAVLAGNKARGWPTVCWEATRPDNSLFFSLRLVLHVCVSVLFCWLLWLLHCKSHRFSGCL